MCCSLQADKDTDFPEVFIVRFEIRTCFEERVLKNRAHVLLVPVTSAA